MKTVIIAGIQSGVGKTTVATGLMAALRQRGWRVQPYKVGPDYIDPSYHRAVCGVASRNLDRWLLSVPTLQAFFRRSASGADIGIIEGVMGIFDGRNGEGERASTAEIAKVLGIPIVLVLDVGKLARTAGALVMGVRAFDPALVVAGVICNNVASARHEAVVRASIEQEAGVPLFGAVRRDATLTLPERYLGLIPMAEGPAAAGYFERLARVIEESVAIERLLESLPEFELAVEESEMLFPPSPQPIQTRIAVAQDQSFHFYYEDGLDLLRAWGAELAPFSPLTDTQLPEGAGGIYIGGGFPELFGRELAANTAMHEALRAAAALGLPIYGECGGAMYLGKMLIDREGQCHRMVGLTPLVSRMMNMRLTLGYRTVTARRETFLLEVGEKLPVHEFHWSMGDGVAMEQAAYAIEGTDRVEGFADGNLLTSYMHVHFGSDGRLAQRFIAACR